MVKFYNIYLQVIANRFSIVSIIASVVIPGGFLILSCLVILHCYRSKLLFSYLCWDTIRNNFKLNGPLFKMNTMRR